MIRPTESLLLASTKLKTRKIRLVITVVITSLLFAVLAFMAIVTEGIIHSFQSFGTEGYGGRYIVQAAPLTYSMGFDTEKEIVDTLLPEQQKIIAAKKAAAKKLNVEYDEKSDQSLPLIAAQNGPGSSSTQYFPNFSSKLVTEYFKKKNESIPGTGIADFSRLAKNAGAINIYSGTQPGGSMNFGMPGGQANESVAVIVDGKENLSAYSGTTSQAGPHEPKGVASITSLGWRNVDAELLTPFILKGQTAAAGKDGSLPVIAPYSAAEEILGLKSLPQTATAKEKLQRLSVVRQQIAGKAAELCYRNGASADLLIKALQQQKEISDRKNDKEYVKPSLLYAIPQTPCGETTISSDKRTTEEKKADANHKSFDEQFGLVEAPAQGVITIRIVGINADINYGAALSPVAILSGLLTSNAGSGWISPTKAVEANSLASNIQGGTAASAERSKVVYYAEFSNVKQMENFIKSQACDGLMQMSMPNGGTQSFDPSGKGDTTRACIDQKKVFTVGPFGNSAGAVDKLKQGIWNFSRYVILVVIIMAALIMMGNIGKIIADSRRETAVFRALGAKRLDITQIYITYTVLVSLLVATFGVMLGAIAAGVLSNKYTPDLSVTAVLAYNAQDINREFSLFGLNPGYILAIIGLTVLTGVLAALLPLLANTRRNPIRDMRDDT